MQIRQYKSADCKQLAELFYQTVHYINSRDYSEEQVNAWATGNIDLQEWDKSFLNNYTVVAVKDNIIVGFGDIDESGYLDRLYVHKDYQRQGIASAICDALECSVNDNHITTHASITAKPFFLNRGYHIIKKQEVLRQGVYLINYVMVK